MLSVPDSRSPPAANLPSDNPTVCDLLCWLWPFVRLNDRNLAMPQDRLRTGKDLFNMQN